jgi:lysozyme family protein
MRHNLDAAMSLIFGQEGGYINARTDRGGPTKFGITARTLGAWRRLGRPATAAEVMALERPEARQIIECQFARPIGFDRLPAGLDYAVLDYAVNSGPAQAIKSLQRVLGVRPLDGLFGAITEEAVAGRPVASVITGLADERMRFLRSLGGAQGFGPNGRGWTMRVTGKDPAGEWPPEPGVVGNALRMASGGSPPAVEPVSPPCGHASASPSQVRVTASREGRSLVAAIIGAVATQVDAVKAAIAPLAGSGGWIDILFVLVTVGGAVLALTGLAVLVAGRLRAIRSGAAV